MNDKTELREIFIEKMGGGYVLGVTLRQIGTEHLIYPDSEVITSPNALIDRVKKLLGIK